MIVTFFILCHFRWWVKEVKFGQISQVLKTWCVRSWMGPGVECSWKPQHNVFCHITGLPSNVKHARRTTELMFDASMPGCEQVGLSESQEWFAGSLLFLLFFDYFTFYVSLLCPLVINSFLNCFVSIQSIGDVYSPLLQSFIL